MSSFEVKMHMAVQTSKSTEHTLQRSWDGFEEISLGQSVAISFASEETFEVVLPEYENAGRSVYGNFLQPQESPSRPDPIHGDDAALESILTDKPDDTVADMAVTFTACDTAKVDPSPRVHERSEPPTTMVPEDGCQLESAYSETADESALSIDSGVFDGLSFPGVDEYDAGDEVSLDLGNILFDTHHRPTPAELDAAKNRRAVVNWYKMLNHLIDFKNVNGNCNVPQKLQVELEGGVAKLGYWVNKQREMRKFLEQGERSLLTPRRVQLLEAIGFVWANPKKDPKWNQRFKEVVQYRLEHGTSNVPCKYPENKALGRWISTQRSQYKLYQAGEPSLMTAERIRMLEEIGFCWDMMMMKRSATKVEVSKFNANRRGVSV